MNLTFIFIAAICLIFGYLLGSLSTAVITCKLMRLPDPRSEGSGNPGATNVLRIGGRKAAIITLLGDALKGFIPVVIVRCLILQLETSIANQIAWLPIGAGLAAFIGHLYPVFFAFKGGKGVATALGVLAGISWPICIMVCLTWLLVAFISKYSALAALVAFALAPLYALYWLGGILPVSAIGIMTVLIFLRHKTNIARLIQGTEGKIRGKT